MKFYDTLVPNLNIATILKNIGNIYEILGRIANVKGDINNSKTKYARALEKYFSAITIYKEKNVEGFVYGTYTDVGKVYMQLNNLSKARIYLEESRSFFEKQIDHGALEIVYKSLSDLDSASGDFPQAYKDYKKSIEHHDSTYVEESAKKTQQITMQYQFDKKEAISKAEQGRKDAETKRTRNVQYFIIGIILLVAFFSTLIIFKNKKQSRKLRMHIASLNPPRPNLSNPKKWLLLVNLPQVLHMKYKTL